MIDFSKRPFGEDRLDQVLFWMSFAAGIGLFAMGAFFAVDHPAGAGLFGVPISDGSGDAYLSAAAIRDVAIGLLTVLFVVLKDRRAVGLCLLTGAIIPIGDGTIALIYSPSPARFVPMHWGSAAVCVILAVLLFRKEKRRVLP